MANQQNQFKVRKGLIVNGSGSVLLDVQGSQGQLFSVTDNLSGSLFAVSDISGIPIMEVFSDDTIKMGTFGDEALTIVENQVGIGTNSPVEKLTVEGNVSASGIFYGDGSGLTNLGTAQIDPAGSNGQLQYNDNESLGGASQLYYDDVNDRVGIGTSSPSYPLHVNDDISSTDSIGYFNNTADTGTQNTIVVDVTGGDRDSGYGIWKQGTEIWSIWNDGALTGDIQDRFMITGDGGSSDVKLTIKQNGNVGINNDDPDVKLTVTGTSGGDGSWVDGILIENTASDTGEASLSFKNAGGNGVGSNYWFTGLNQQTAYRIAYGTSFNNGNTLFTIETGGNVGIGTTTPSSDGYSFAEDLVIKGGASSSDGVGITLLSNTQRYSIVAFGDSTDTNVGEIFYDHDQDRLAIRRGGTVELELKSSGIELGVGLTGTSATFTGNVDINSNILLNSDGTSTFTGLTSLDGGINVNDNLAIDTSGNITKGGSIDIGSSSLSAGNLYFGEQNATVDGLRILNFHESAWDTGDRFVQRVGQVAGNERMDWIWEDSSTSTTTLIRLDKEGNIRVFGLSSLDGGVNINSNILLNADGTSTFTGLSSLDGGINVNDNLAIDTSGNITKGGSIDIGSSSLTAGGGVLETLGIGGNVPSTASGIFHVFGLIGHSDPSDDNRFRYIIDESNNLARWRLRSEKSGGSTNTDDVISVLANGNVSFIGNLNINSNILLNADGTISKGSITSNFGSIDIGSSSLSAGGGNFSSTVIIDRGGVASDTTLIFDSTTGENINQVFRSNGSNEYLFQYNDVGNYFRLYDYSFGGTIWVHDQDTDVFTIKKDTNINSNILLNSDGTISKGSITSGFGNIDIGSNDFKGRSIELENIEYDDSAVFSGTEVGGKLAYDASTGLALYYGSDGAGITKGIAVLLDVNNTITDDFISITGGTSVDSQPSLSFDQSQITGTGALDAGSITSNFGSIDIGSSSVTAGDITGTTATFTGEVDAQGGIRITSYSGGEEAYLTYDAGTNISSWRLGSVGAPRRSHEIQLNYADGIKFYVDDNSGGVTEVLKINRITGNAEFAGNIDIGTNDLSAGDVLISNGTSDNMLTLFRDNNASDTEVGILFKDRNVVSGGQDAGRIYTERQGSSSTYDLVFNSADANSLNEVLRLTHDKVAEFSGSINLDGILTTTSFKGIGGNTSSIEGRNYSWWHGSSDTSGDVWRKVADVTLPTGLYQALALSLTYYYPSTNWGQDGKLNTYQYTISFSRSGGSQDNEDTAYIYGNNSNLVRVVKVSTGVYELQARANSSNKSYGVEYVITSAGSNATLTPVDGIVSGTTTGTVYTASQSPDVNNVLAGDLTSYNLTANNDLTVSGNISVTGTVDGRDVASDGTKLDTIETSAKDDQTITAGAGLTGGGTGNVTLNVVGGSGITANANDITVDSTVARTNVSETFSGAITMNSNNAFVTSHIQARGGNVLTVGSGEMGSTLRSNLLNSTSEALYIGGESGVVIVSSPDNLSSGWAGRNQAHLVKTNGQSDFPAQINVTGDGNSAQWQQAYNNYITGVSGNGDGTLTLTQRDGGTVTTNLAHSHSEYYESGDTPLFEAIDFNNNEIIDYAVDGRLYWDLSAGLYIQSSNANHANPALLWSSANFIAGTGLNVSYDSEDQPSLEIDSTVVQSGDNVSFGTGTFSGEVSTSKVNLTGLQLDFNNGDGRISYDDSNPYGTGGVFHLWADGGQGNATLQTEVVRATRDIYLGSRIYHDGDTNTYLQFHASDQFRVVTGGSENFEITNSSVNVRENLLVDNGTNTTVTVQSDDAGESVIELYGGSQGTGRVFVGQSASYGGGILYNGDGTPAYGGAGSDDITLYRVSAGTPNWTAQNNYNDNNWRFRGDLTSNASDGRLKENVRNIDNAISKILTINGVHFDWKDECEDLGFLPTRKEDIGVIAQEIEKVLPDAVRTAPFDYSKKNGSKSGENYLTVKYEKLTPLLIEGIKEQQGQIEELKSENESLRNELAEIKELIKKHIN